MVVVAVLKCAGDRASAFYDPGLQRWVNRDPIEERGGINLFQFVGNDPMTRLDAFGRDQWGCTLEGEVSLFGGIDVGVSFVYDTGDARNSGFYTSYGPARGITLGAGVGAIYAPESIVGHTVNIDANMGVISPTLSLDPLNQGIFSNVALTGFLPGIGLAASETATDPLFTWGDLADAWNDFFDDWLSPWSQLNRGSCGH